MSFLFVSCKNGEKNEANISAWAEIRSLAQGAGWVPMGAVCYGTCPEDDTHREARRARDEALHPEDPRTTEVEQRAFWEGDRLVKLELTSNKDSTPTVVPMSPIDGYDGDYTWNESGLVVLAPDALALGDALMRAIEAGIEREEEEGWTQEREARWIDRLRDFARFARESGGFEIL